MRLLILGAFALFIALPASAAPLVASPSEAFVLLNGATVFKEKNMGNLEWQENLTLGDKVILLGGVIKEKYNGNERDYYKVKLPNGKEGFVRTSMLGVGGALGVVKADASFIYSEPRDVKVTDRTLGRGQLVVVLKEGATDQFVPVVGYEETKDLTVAGAFLVKEDVSINDVDVNTIILLSVAKAQKSPVLKKNLLTVASTKYSTSLFQDMVNAQLNLVTPPRAVKAAAGSYTVNDDNVNVRDLPNEKGSKVLGTLTKGKTVDVTETTAESYTVDGQTALWYHLKDNGWVFGVFLTPAP